MPCEYEIPQNAFPQSVSVAMLQHAEITHQRVSHAFDRDAWITSRVRFPQPSEPVLHLERALFPESDMVAPYAVSAEIDALRLGAYARFLVEFQR